MPTATSSSIHLQMDLSRCIAQKMFWNIQTDGCGLSELLVTILPVDDQNTDMSDRLSLRFLRRTSKSFSSFIVNPMGDDNETEGAKEFQSLDWFCCMNFSLL